MRAEGHLDKAKAFEDRARRMETERDAPSAMEDVYNALVHYVAYGIIIKYGRDLDSHSAQKRFLRDRDRRIFDLYDEIEDLRIGSVYGGKWNGDRVDRGLKLLLEVKKWSKETG